MVALTLAALLAVAPMQVPQQAPVPQASVPPQEAPVDLGEIEVTGRPLDSMIRSFVDEVAAPNRRRGIARWDDRICVGVANLRAEPAQYIVDRVSTVAEDLGVIPGDPGCQPNVIIIASDDPDGLARQLTEERRRAFRMGGSGMDRGGRALENFVANDAPVRWWQVSMPANSETGQRATRIPGECRDPCMSTSDYAPVIATFAASRLSTQIVDYIFRTVVILDIDQIGGVSGQQLADYVAMVTLAQIDPQADTSRYASILNVFDAPDTAPGLTDWDQAYLRGLYDAERTRKNLHAGTTEIADSIYQAHQDLRADEEE
ncbi:MAG: hypothetical protein QME55_14505 [Brevundimonas sp.]|uniref:hypothetical protein n=1 Tax=Brevundimonas sp. TaxID=1871086 RepID=UPI002618BD36|nr:hypothetical protein [Brevundimonas sp.]MDI6625939.1 hypothetical protein [Brevundimonas sp.]MDQ7811951.1 hypothetical protein [Brevundimonas sp.]